MLALVSSVGAGIGRSTWTGRGWRQDWAGYMPAGKVWFCGAHSSLAYQGGKGWGDHCPVPSECLAPPFNASTLCMKVVAVPTTGGWGHASQQQAADFSTGPFFRV